MQKATKNSDAGHDTADDSKRDGGGGGKALKEKGGEATAANGAATTITNTATAASHNAATSLSAAKSGEWKNDKGADQKDPSRAAEGKRQRQQREADDAAEAKDLTPVDSKKQCGSASSSQKGKFHNPVPFPAGNRRTNMPGSSNYWHVPEKERVIGLGTVGLYENQNNNKPLPKGASACINGTVIVGPSVFVRKLKEYVEWREKHSNLFSTLREQDEKERQMTRMRRIREKEKQREEEDHEYASAVRRLRRRGWSVLDNSPRKVDHTRVNQLKAEREAFHAECEETMMRKIKDASKQREDISQQLAMCKNEVEHQQSLLRDAARVEREMQNAKREEHLALVKQRAATTRAEREAEREYLRGFAATEDKYRREKLATLRERIFAKTHTDGFGCTFSCTMSRTEKRYPSGDWRNTFISPLCKLPNASDDTFRRQWTTELKEERQALAREEVMRTKRQQTSHQREATYRENCQRAEALRGEKGMLRERKQQQEEEIERFHKTLRQNEIEGQKRREEAIRALRESKRLRASRLRQALEEEEKLVQTMEVDDLQRLRERAAQMKNNMSSPCHQHGNSSAEVSLID